MRIRDSVGATGGMKGALRRKIVARKTAAAQESGRRHELVTQVRSDGAGEEYRAEGTD